MFGILVSRITGKFIYGQSYLTKSRNVHCYAHDYLYIQCITDMRGLTLRRLMSYIYGAPILDVSRSHTTTQHSREDSSG